MNKKMGLKATILSLSIFTVMSGAAVAPALGSIAQYFTDVHPLLIKMVLTLPALCIIAVSLLFRRLTCGLSPKYIAHIGLVLYLVGGAGAGLVNSIALLLLLRAVLGVGIGLLMPLSTGLISYYFEPNEQGTLLGYSSAMMSIGAIISTTLSGYLVHISWRYSFFVYSFAFISFVLVHIFLPAAPMQEDSPSAHAVSFLQNSFYYFSMFFTMLVFYVFISHFSLICTSEKLFGLPHIGAIMSLQNIASLLCGLYFGKASQILKEKTAYFSAVFFIAGYFVLAYTFSVILMVFGLLLIGIALGFLVPYLNTEALARTPKEQAASVMAYMAAAMHLGQFASPFTSRLFTKFLHAEYIRFPYFFGIASAVVLAALLYVKKDRFAS